MSIPRLCVSRNTIQDTLIINPFMCNSHSDSDTISTNEHLENVFNI